MPRRSKQCQKSNALPRKQPRPPTQRLRLHTADPQTCRARPMQDDAAVLSPAPSRAITGHDKKYLSTTLVVRRCLLWRTAHSKRAIPSSPVLAPSASAPGQLPTTHHLHYSCTTPPDPPSALRGHGFVTAYHPARHTAPSISTTLGAGAVAHSLACTTSYFRPDISCP